jgi:hypothetical protein
MHTVLCPKKSFAQSGKFLKKDSSEVAGNWMGSSVCQVKNSPCHDEIVEYNILKADSGLYHVSMNKIVDGKINFMGVVDCAYDESTKTLSFSGNGRIWQFTMKHTTMDGILIWRDQLYRKIHLEKK